MTGVHSVPYMTPAPLYASVPLAEVQTPVSMASQSQQPLVSYHDQLGMQVGHMPMSDSATVQPLIGIVQGPIDGLMHRHSPEAKFEVHTSPEPPPLVDLSTDLLEPELSSSPSRSLPSQDGLTTHYSNGDFQPEQHRAVSPDEPDIRPATPTHLAYGSYPAIRDQSTPDEARSFNVVLTNQRGGKRGPFKDPSLREQTAQTRRMGSCIRCRMQRIRVSGISISYDWRRLCVCVCVCVCVCLCRLCPDMCRIRQTRPQCNTC